jgi:hypothetical protein
MMRLEALTNKELVASGGGGRRRTDAVVGVDAGEGHTTGEGLVIRGNRGGSGGVGAAAS